MKDPHAAVVGGGVPIGGTEGARQLGATEGPHQLETLLAALVAELEQLRRLGASTPHPSPPRPHPTPPRPAAPQCATPERSRAHTAPTQLANAIFWSEAQQPPNLPDPHPPHPHPPDPPDPAKRNPAPPDPIVSSDRSAPPAAVAAEVEMDHAGEGVEHESVGREGELADGMEYPVEMGHDATRGAAVGGMEEGGAAAEQEKRGTPEDLMDLEDRDLEDPEVWHDAEDAEGLDGLEDEDPAEDADPACHLPGDSGGPQPSSAAASSAAVSSAVANSAVANSAAAAVDVTDEAASAAAAVERSARCTWKAVSGRGDEYEGYRFGDLTRTTLRKLTGS